ncbi:porin family protein [Larkinella soli]|uniref:porin family protein n=1 Tax=Larkinella soli TaxID=1770527 RepID=UPI000FFBC40F|nr:porin family protein [Larkinella soli]
MKSTFFTLCLVAAGLTVQAQTTKPKTAPAKPATTTAKTTATTTAAKPKPATTAAKKPVTAAKKPVAKPTVAAATPAPTPAAAPATETVVAQQTTTPAAEAPTTSATTTTKPAAGKKNATARAEKPARPEKPTRPAASGSASGKGLSVGLRGGANLILNESVASFEEVDLKEETVPGFTAGVIVNYGFSSVFSVQPEILYTRRTVKYAASVQGEKFELQMDANAVEVPLLLKLSFGRKARVFVNAGPYISYGLNGQLKMKYAGESQTEKDDYKNVDGRLEYGATGGIGASLPLGPGSLLIEGRFNYGLGTNAEKTPADYVNPMIGTVSVGYIIPLGK